ncbi:MAG: helix-turn-helix domain-containing protein [Candidatus Gracilibacteria bacterium]|nr:helix-turn-helix domain-containing protein [Candidatus Gracilibacteria bacterium]MDD2908217.1 helix-turn-helix domain-containing protein [Candidatus Gracilibacteria bacterium]
MYSIDRDEAAKELNISTRTIDRYIRSGKIRSQKKGKKIFLNTQDIEIIKNGGIQEDYEVIKPREKQEETGFVTKSIENSRSIKNLYEDTLRVIEKKDDVIKDLSYKLGRAEVELKNSIPIIEYKKTTFLLESTNNKSEEEKKELTNNIENLKDKVRSQELLNIIMIGIFSILLVVVFLVWFANI